MYISLDAFYNYDLLISAKNSMKESIKHEIQGSFFDPKDPDAEFIQFEDAKAEIYIENGWIDLELDAIPSILQDQYKISNIIEYNKMAALLSFLDLNKPPKSYAAKHDEVAQCELYLIALIIENAILLTFHLSKLGEFQFYNNSNVFIGILDRVRLSRDPFSGLYSNYDFLIFSGMYKIEKKHVEFLKDTLDLIDEQDYCLKDLPAVLEELENLTSEPIAPANMILEFEKRYNNRVKIPKRPIFYRIPFLAWDQRQDRFFVSQENMSEVIY